MRAEEEQGDRGLAVTDALGRTGALETACKQGSVTHRAVNQL